MKRFHALALALALGSAPRAGAQLAPSRPPTVTLVTFGEGREVFERFGHDALRFEDPATGLDTVYHWGLFDFNAPDFVARFVSGDTRYWMGGENGSARIEYEWRSGRQVTLQRLALSPAQASALYDFVRWNAQDAHKYYRYDYFRDNCATRLRDALDGAVGGAIKRATDTVHTRLTYRGESLRLTDAERPAQAGIDLALGPRADRPLTQWETFFIPMRLRDALRTVRVSDGRGALVPIVAEERVLPTPPSAEPIPELATLPRLWPRYLLAGALLALVIVGLRIMAVSRRSAVWGLAIAAAGWNLLCGLLGIAITLAGTATKHVFWAWNENLLLLTPLCLVLVVLAPALLLSGRAARATRALARAVAALGVVALLLMLLPGGQQSGEIVALLLPVHLALAWAIALPRHLAPPRTRVR